MWGAGLACGGFGVLPPVGFVGVVEFVGGAGWYFEPVYWGDVVYLPVVVAVVGDQVYLDAVGVCDYLRCDGDFYCFVALSEVVGN